MSDVAISDCPCGGPKVNGVTHHMSRCPHRHVSVADHYEQVAKQARRSQRRETAKYVLSGRAIWDWTMEDWEHKLFVIAMILCALVVAWAIWWPR